ncbi:YiiG family protein [Bartonella sp. HY406]|uniref:YiiG family protein n=1 Tax=Bartonella sp. HY406 TaxID=2979331 RepID=UPI0021C8E55C|nr:YiiG family protein [Bartonella sp. HY406]UXN02687.1 YiiG family protein [Bartonella sp. HY406]
MRKFIRQVFVALCFTGALSCSFVGSVFAQTQEEASEGVDRAAVAKTNAYVSLLNRTLRANESLNFYKSWVDMKVGPTGKERHIYGNYPTYDVKSLIESARAKIDAEPAMPELDKAVAAYIEVYEKLAPVLNKAYKYYERQDYKSDKMAGGKEYHKVIAELDPLYTQTLSDFEKALNVEKDKLDLALLDQIEKQEGKKDAWHKQNVMLRAHHVMDLLPSNETPIVDMKEFNAAMEKYGTAVKDMDDYTAENPSALMGFEVFPSQLLGSLRTVQEVLAKNKGDGRKGGVPQALQMLTTTYNTMVTLSSM